ncbi:tyrosine-type recombinase/integrase [Emticicia sp. 17c]|uniref:tyrosine-type recombinase/integrase n=1 Tax=Emticicia sp. 17c TaxID=3127704 RepID=UPI00301DAC8E
MYPTIRFRPRKDGNSANLKLYCFIRFNGLTATRFSTNIDCIYTFDLKKQIFNGSKNEVNSINDQLINIRTEIREIFNKLNKLNHSFTAQMIRDRYVSEKKLSTIKIPTSLECFQEYIQHRNQTENLEKSTLDKITYSKKQFECFLKTHYNRKDLELRAITNTVANNYFNYLQLQKNNQGLVVSYEHCYRTLQNLIKCLTYAVQKQYLLSNPLLELGIENKVQSPKVEPLPFSDIIKLINCEGCSDTEKKVLDGFLIMCFTGFRHSDYVRFLKQPKNYIFKDESDFEYIELLSFKNRKDKNQESSYIPLHPVVKNILEHYHYNLAIYSDQVINRYIKIIATRAGITSVKKITTYTARKSCASYYGNLDGFDVKSVSKILGHKRVSTTEKHYFRVDKETVKRQFLKATN